MAKEDDEEAAPVFSYARDVESEHTKRALTRRLQIT